MDEAMPTRQTLDHDLAQRGVTRSRTAGRCRGSHGCRRAASPRSGRCARPRASSAPGRRAGRRPAQQAEQDPDDRSSRGHVVVVARQANGASDDQHEQDHGGNDETAPSISAAATRAAPAGEPAREADGRPGAAGCCQPPGGTAPVAGRLRRRPTSRGPARRRWSGGARPGAGLCGPAWGCGDWGLGGLPWRRGRGPGRPGPSRRRGSRARAPRRGPWVLGVFHGGALYTPVGGRLVLEHDLLAPAQEAARQRHGGEQRRDRQRDLHAQDALLRPVDVVELEQQRGLVEREAHARRRTAPRASARGPRCE